MSSFTRETWRRGKRRGTYARVKPWGGKTEAPAAFLATSGSIAGIGSGKHRICEALKRDGTPCRDIAMRSVPYCHRHMGAVLTALHVRPYVSRSGKVTIPLRLRRDNGDTEDEAD